MSKLVEIIEDKQVVIDKSDLDFIYKQKADLEAKLAESEKRIQAYEEIVEQKDEEISFANRDKTCIVKQLNDPKAYVLLEDYKQLKQQLAENQKKKEDFKTMYFNKCLDYEHLHEKFDDKCAEFELKEYDYKQTIFEKDQDKISFCVEHLEKVKEFCEANCDKCDDLETGGYCGKVIGLDNVLYMGDMSLYDYIDNQIASLKKGVE